MADRSGRRDMMPEETGKKRRSSVIVCLPGPWPKRDFPSAPSHLWDAA